MAKRSFIDEVSPNRPRQRPIDWPLGGGRKVLVRILGDDEIESAYFAARDHFDAMKVRVNGKDVKRAVDIKDPAFVNRERVELVYRAFRAIDEDGTQTDDHIAASAAELAKYSDRIIDSLYLAWAEYQKESQAKPVDEAAVREIIDALKKNTPAGAYSALPSSWLIAVITGLVEESQASQMTNGSG